MTREPEEAGLCESCVHTQVVTSVRGSTFHLCKLSFVDSRLAKYPALPVRQCPGYYRDVKKVAR